MDDFDWVTARLECSARKVFEQLKLAIQRDIQIRNATLPQDSGVEFQVTDAGDRLVVLRYIKARSSHTYIPKSVGFVVRDERISFGIGDESWTASLTLNKQGRCILRLDGEELELWEFRMRALEELLF